MLPLTDFVLAHLPPAPARVLEVGCGRGDLALELVGAGYDVTAIDPQAPEGEIFRRIKLEDVEEDERFDAVVASRSFHDMTNLGLNLERVRTVLGGQGRFVLDELAWEQLDVPTGDWYERQRRALLAAGREPHGAAAAEWETHHAGVHESNEILAALRACFDELHFERVPYLFRYLDGVATARLEEALVAAGAIRPLGFRFVGMPLAAASLGEA